MTDRSAELLPTPSDFVGDVEVRLHNQRGFAVEGACFRLHRDDVQLVRGGRCLAGFVRDELKVWLSQAYPAVFPADDVVLDVELGLMVISAGTLRLYVQDDDRRDLLQKI